MLYECLNLASQKLGVFGRKPPPHFIIILTNISESATIMFNDVFSINMNLLDITIIIRNLEIITQEATKKKWLNPPSRYRQLSRLTPLDMIYPNARTFSGVSQPDVFPKDSIPWMACTNVHVRIHVSNSNTMIIPIRTHIMYLILKQ